MKKYLFLFLSLFFFYLQAQNSPVVYGISLDSIQSWVKEKPSYFKALQRKFQKTDLSDSQMVMLYYGTAFLPDYAPQKADEEMKVVYDLTGNMDFDSGLKAAESLIKKYPVNARLYMLAGYAAKKTGNEKKADFYYKKYADLLRVPLYSGTGESFKKAYIVRSTSDEFLILNQQGLELLTQEVRYFDKMPYDKMTVNTKASPEAKKDLYFNIYLPLFVAHHINYRDKQLEAIKRYKVDSTKYPQSIEKIKKNNK